MTSNAYAKVYRTESRGQKNEEFAFISYMDEPNSFSVVSVKRLIDVDKFSKGFIREKNKNYRITVERTGTLVEMEQLVKEAEEASAYTMNTDIVSDTEEWHKRKRSVINKNQEQTNILDKQLTDLHSFDFDGNRTYTTLATCVLDELNDTIDYPRASFDQDDDDDGDEESNDEQDINKIVNHHGLVPILNRKRTSKQKKRTTSTISRGSSTKRLRTNDVSLPTEHQDNLDVDQSPSLVSSVLKELNHNFVQLRKQSGNLIQVFDQQQKTLNIILHNQKKMAKAMRTHKIPIALFDETESQALTTITNENGVIYKLNNNEEINLTGIPFDRTKPNKFVLQAVGKLFNDQELLDIEARCLDTDARVTAIRGQFSQRDYVIVFFFSSTDAVQAKFGLTTDEITTVWTPMLDCIKSKRRNLKKKGKTIITPSNNLGNSSENQSIQSLSPAGQNLTVQETDEQF